MKFIDSTVNALERIRKDQTPLRMTEIGQRGEETEKKGVQLRLRTQSHQGREPTEFKTRLPGDFEIGGPGGHGVCKIGLISNSTLT